MTSLISLLITKSKSFFMIIIFEHLQIYIHVLAKLSRSKEAEKAKETVCIVIKKSR